jgi:hypothetical protein
MDFVFPVDRGINAVGTKEYRVIAMPGRKIIAYTVKSMLNDVAAIGCYRINIVVAVAGR